MVETPTLPDADTSKRSPVRISWNEPRASRESSGDVDPVNRYVGKNAAGSDAVGRELATGKVARATAGGERPAQDVASPTSSDRTTAGFARPGSACIRASIPEGRNADTRVFA
jgi:hypothetical protein